MCKVACLLLGGPDYEMVAGGRTWLVELHPYSGPSALNKRTGDPLDRDPGKVYWDGIERWIAGGELVRGRQLVIPDWCSKCRGFGSMVKGNLIVGRCPQCEGKRVVHSDISNAEVLKWRLSP